MLTFSLILLGKSLAFVSKALNRGAGSTWPGHIALKAQKTFIQELLKNAPIKIILVVGTNGKTTTAKILCTILEENDYKVFENTSGANLLNGIASSLLLHTNAKGRLVDDFAIFEVDENNVSLVMEEVTPYAIIVLNLFRDQLDRYGELDSIAAKWKRSFDKLPSSTNLFLNADDPLIAYLGLSRSPKSHPELHTVYFGLTSGIKQPLSHAADTIYCPRCQEKLVFNSLSYSHLGDWWCKHCGLKRPKLAIDDAYYPLEGIYNKYNTLAAVVTAQSVGLDKEQIKQALHTVTPAFGRQEKISYKGKHIQIFLSKNPTGFNETLRTISALRQASNQALNVLLILNDQIPDGRDVSWIWDIDFEQYIERFEHITISGERAYDMGLRLQYASNEKFLISNFKLNSKSPRSGRAKYYLEQDLKKALDHALENTPINETLYILPTYSAMLDIRKILTGKKIL